MAPSTSSTRHRDVSSGASSSSSLSGSPYTIVVSDGGASHLVSFAQGSLSFSLCHPSPADPTSRVDTRRPNPFPTKPLPLENVVFVRIRQQAIDFINSTSNAAQGMMPIVFEVLYMGRGPSAGVSIFNLITDTKSWNSFCDRHDEVAKVFSKPHRYSSSSNTSVTVIVNPEAGASGTRAQDFVTTAVEPILLSAGIDFTVVQTKGVDDAGRIGREVLARPGDSKTIVVVGGDGTVHELLNGIMLTSSSKAIKVDLVLVPFGTANALYYSLFPPESPSTAKTRSTALLYSLLAFIDGTSSTAAPLSVAINTLPTAPHHVITSVVSSAALHANILLDSEKLRSTIPGVERFKHAAMANNGKWWNGTLKLMPEEGKRFVELYDPTSKTFKPMEQSTEERAHETNYTLDQQTGSVCMTGPYAYIVSSLVSRFEDTFLVAPFRSSLSRFPPSTSSTSASIDVVLIRPFRDLATAAMFRAAQGDRKKEGELRVTFSGTVWNAMKGMYNGGTHVDTKYLSFEPSPKSVVEYFRVGGLSWEPDASDDLKDNVVCLDGALRDLGSGGKLETRPLSAESSGVRVWS